MRAHRYGSRVFTSRQGSSGSTPRKRSSFAIFVVLFAVLSVSVPTFLTVPNLLALLQSVAFLGFLDSDGGRGHRSRHRHIDDRCCRRPAGNTSSARPVGTQRSYAGVFSLAVAIVFGLLNGWLIAYAEVPSLFTTLASGLFLAGFGQVFFFPVDVVQWSPDLYSLSWIGRGDVLGIPKPSSCSRWQRQ